MSTTALLSEITALPPELRQEVEDFVAFLRAKKKPNKAYGSREFGYAKVRLAEDFDAPLEGFNEYT